MRFLATKLDVLKVTWECGKVHICSRGSVWRLRPVVVVIFSMCIYLWVHSRDHKSHNNILRFWRSEKEMKKVFVFAIVAAVAVVALEVAPAEGVTCSPVELGPCLAAITSSSPPSTACCQKVREQRPCLCGYLKNPSFKNYVNSPGSRRVATSCGVPFPTC